MWALPKRAAEEPENTENSCFQTGCAPLKVVGVARMWFGSFNTIIRLNDVGVTGSYESFISEISGAEIRKVAKIDCFGLF